MTYKINYSSFFISIDGAVADGSLANSEATMYLDGTSKDIIMRYRDDVGTLHTAVVGDSTPFVSNQILYGDSDGSFGSSNHLYWNDSTKVFSVGDAVYPTAPGSFKIGGSGNTFGGSTQHSGNLGGTSNVVDGARSVSLGGDTNTVSGSEAISLAGNNNTVSGDRSLGWGNLNTVAGINTFGGGKYANPTGNNTFMLNLNGGSVANVTSTVSGSFVVLTTGGSVFGAADPTTNSELSVVSTTKASIPSPVMTEVQRDAIGTPSSGMSVFNSDTSLPNYYTGASWLDPFVETSLTQGQVVFGASDGNFGQTSDFFWDNTNKSLSAGNGLLTSIANTVLLGGQTNTITAGTESGVFCGEQNDIVAGSQTVINGGLGSTNTAGNNNFFGGGTGNLNTSGGQNGLVGGNNNKIHNGVRTVMLGGNTNDIGLTSGGNDSGIIAGSNNTIDVHDNAFMGGGLLNTINGAFSSGATLGGTLNTVSAAKAVVLGGDNNTAAGESSIAGGTFANAATSHTFMLNMDSTSAANVTSTVADSFVVLTGGGAVFGSPTSVASAELAVDSTTKGFRLPKMTTTQMNAIASPDSGLLIFDTTTSQGMLYNGTAWVIFG